MTVTRFMREAWQRKPLLLRGALAGFEPPVDRDRLLALAAHPEGEARLIEQVNQKYGNTIIMVTHNDAIKNMADRVVKLRDGQIRKNYLNESKVAADDLDW